MDRHAPEVREQYVRQHFRVAGAVVLPGDERVFKGNTPPRGFEIIGAGAEQLRDGITPVHRHDGAPRLVGRGMERDGEGDRQILLRKVIDARDDAAGREGNVPVADVQPRRVPDKAQKFHHVVIVVERLSDAHEHHAVDALARVERRGDDLPEHLGRGQVPHLAANRGGTELTAHGAPDLARNAQGGAVAVAHEHALDAVAVEEAEEVFDGAVEGARLLDLHRGEPPLARLVEPFSQGGGEVGHFGNGGAAAAPVEDLLRAVARLAERGKIRLDLLREQG